MVLNLNMKKEKKPHLSQADLGTLLPKYLHA